MRKPWNSAARRIFARAHWEWRAKAAIYRHAEGHSSNRLWNAPSAGTADGGCNPPLPVLNLLAKIRSGLRRSVSIVGLPPVGFAVRLLIVWQNLISQAAAPKPFNSPPRIGVWCWRRVTILRPRQLLLLLNYAGLTGIHSTHSFAAKDTVSMTHRIRPRRFLHGCWRKTTSRKLTAGAGGFAVSYSWHSPTSSPTSGTRRGA